MIAILSQLTKSNYTILLLLTIVTAICYSNGLTGDFLSDDILLITRNYDIHNLNLSALFTRDYFGAGGNEKVYRPMILLSFAINYYFGGLESFSYHLVNIILHLFNALLIYHLTLHYTEHKSIAILNAMFFSVHPVRTEAVTWISGRSELLSAFFLLLSWTAFIRLNRGKYVVTAVLFLLALLSKESTATLPAIILMSQFYKTYQGEGIRSWLKKNLKPYAIFVAPIVIYVLVKIAVLGTLTIPNSAIFFKDVGVISRLCTMTIGFLNYFRLMLWPDRLCFDYDFSVIPRQDNITAEVAIAGGLILGLFVLGVVLFKRERIISYSILFFFISIFIVSNILVPIGILIAERVLYLPAISVGLIVARLLSLLLDKPAKIWKFATAVVICFIITAASIRCIERNKDWQNAKSYGEAYVRDAPGNVKGRFVRAAVFEGEGRLKEAENEYRLAVLLSPKLAHTHSALGVFLYQQKRYQESYECIQKALALSDRNIEALVMMGKLLNIQGDRDKALEYLLKAAQLSPDNIPLYLTLATTLQQLERHEEAIKYLKRILELESDKVEALYALALSLTALNRVDEALQLLEMSLRLSPNYIPCIYQHAVLLFRKERLDEALQKFQRALTLGLDIPQLHNYLGMIYAKKGLTDQAKDHFIAALRLQPSYEEAKRNLDSLSN
ncbi:MAG: tetratricopeptide repeat protein [Acidobacteriota bacterium]|nr:tetratricopeptide repeat protein [Blastocatellia bacterium]MDW8412610.1 tetratricopeptide repeat protein [Acidobacteriota bacterium]